MKPTLVFARHQYADTILRHEFRTTYEELISVFEEVDIPLNPTEPFSNGRPSVPKRHKDKSKKVRYILKPVSQHDWNDILAKKLQDKGWASQPIAIGDEKTKQTKQKGDFAKDKVFVEVEFGNSASSHRDMLKFLIAHDTGTARIGVLACMTQRLATLADSGLTNFETVKRNILPFLRLTPMPILFVGLDYHDSDEHILRNHYDIMYNVATSNGVSCRSSSEVFGNADLLLEEEIEANDDDLE
jgi:hypothetical protein